MRALLYSAAAATALTLASAASAQETIFIGGAPPKPVAGDEVVVVPPGTPVTIVQVLPPLPPPTLAAPRPPATPPPAAVTPASIPETKQAAWVHLQGGPNLALEAVLPDRTDWKLICRAPCDVQVPLDALYRVTSPGMQTSKSMRLAATDGDRVTITVNPTSDGTHVGGEALIILGGIGLFAGGVLLYADAITAAVCSTPYSQCSGSGPLLWTGIGSAAAGAVGLIAGIRMIQPTGVEQSAGGGDARERAAARDDRYTRSPIWRDALQLDPTPRVTSVPIFSTTF
jgi:hypothetical protein